MKIRIKATKYVSIGLLQIDSKSQDVEGNLSRIIDCISKAANQDANLIIAPELALSGFLFSKDDYLTVAQTIPGPATEEVGLAARNANAYVIFGLPEKSEQGLYNSLAVMGPNGNLVTSYRKPNLWINEKEFFKQGDKLCIYKTEFGKVGCTICYDFVFPELIRALTAQGAVVITHSTGWLSTEEMDAFGKDVDHYHSIVRVRAWENQIYFASCNRCGSDRNQYYLANSCVATPWGALVGKLGQAEGTLVVKTEWARLAKWQEFAPYWEDLKLDFYEKTMNL